MTQPVAPGARVACFDEPIAEPLTCTSPPPCMVSPAVCAVGLEERDVVAARAPPVFEPRIPDEPAGLRFCREANTVAEGFLCNERVVVSDACRKPNNAVDAYICDEPRMHALQDDVWQGTLWLVKSIVAQLFGRTKSP